MFNKLFLICLLIGISNCVKLENTCNIYEYKGYKKNYEINAVHRIQFTTKFQNISYYLVDENAQYDDLITNKTQIQMMKEATKQFNYGFNQFYNEQFINNKLNEINKYYELIFNYYLTTKEILSNIDEDKKKLFVARFYDQFKEGGSLYFSLVHLNANSVFYLDFENRSLFRKMLSKLDFDEDGQVYIFKNIIYEILGIKAQVAKFKSFVKDNQSKGLLTVDIFLPFVNSNYTRKNCVSRTELPVFYQHLSFS